MTTPLRVGDLLNESCGGYFGRNYRERRVEAIGSDWVVAREDDGQVVFAEIEPEDLTEYRIYPTGDHDG